MHAESALLVLMVRTILKPPQDLVCGARLNLPESTPSKQEGQPPLDIFIIFTFQHFVVLSPARHLQAEVTNHVSVLAGAVEGPNHLMHRMPRP